MQILRKVFLFWDYSCFDEYISKCINVIFELSYWWLLPFLFLSAIVAWFKYKKLSQLPDIPFIIRIVVPLFRFLTIFLLCFLLLNPVRVVVHKIKEKPLLVIAQDNSSSIIKNKDSLYYLTDYKENLDKAILELQEKFDIENWVFGSSVRLNDSINFSDSHTDISEVMEYATERFMTRRPAGMVLLTDGLCNSGVNPRYKLPDFPIWTVGLGDTISYPDVYIRSVETDKFNFINTVFPLKLEFGALKQKGGEVKCILLENGKRIAEKTLIADHEHFLSEVLFDIEATHKGIIKYTLLLESNKPERTLENNRIDTWVQIIDNATNIAIIAEAPHPDVSAIVNALNMSSIYHPHSYYFYENLDTLKADVFILHNPSPASGEYGRLIEKIRQDNSSIWYILTDRDRIKDFAQANGNYSVDFSMSTDKYEYAFPKVNDRFPYFEFTDEEIKEYESYPPLEVPLGKIDVKAGYSLINQQINNTPTNNGMFVFYQQAGQRIAYLWGEGLWKWRMFSYNESGNHESFNTLVHKIVNYLSLDKGGERLVHDFRPVYGEEEEILLNVELYNDSYELFNTPDMNLKLKQGEHSYNYLLNRTDKKYRIQLGNLTPGEYNYQLMTELNGEKLEKEGIFYVRSYSPEQNNVVADHLLLRDIAKNTNGAFFSSRDIEVLVRQLNNNEQFKSVYKLNTETEDLNKMKLLGLIILVLLCVEWFLLRYYAE